jgi:hypothetical protein
MFQGIMEQARSMIQRLHASAEQGRDAVPEAMRVRYSELEAWDAATQGIIKVAFGADAVELSWWRTLTERRGAIVGEAMRKDIKRGEYFGLIDFFHLAIGALLEFEARYQHRLASPSTASLHTAVALIDRLSPQDQERLARLMTHDSPNGQLQAASPAPADSHAHAASPPPGDIPTRAARQAANHWELTISVTPETYRWLYEAAAAREPASAGEGDAAARLAATIVERVVTNTRNSRR